MATSSDDRPSRYDRRRFTLQAAAFAAGLCAGGAIRPAAALGGEPKEKPTVRQRLWLWGHPAGCHTKSPDQWGLPGRSRIAPAEAAASMAVPNLLMVRYDLEPKPPLVEYARPMKGLDQVVWSIEGGGGADVDAVLDLRRTLPNLRGVIMDDYFGRVTSLAPPTWLADNRVQFPVTLVMTFPQAIQPDRMDMVQSAWPTGDYRSRRFAVDTSVDTSTDGNSWIEAARGTLPNAPLATAQGQLPGKPIRSLRVRILDTHDTDKALSCGLAGVRLWSNGRQVPLSGARIRASSEYCGHPASGLLVAGLAAESGPFSLSALKRLRGRLDAASPRLDLWVVLYTHELSFGPLLQPHLELCDVVTMWTWKAEDVARLEESFREFEKLVGPKRKVLGLYLWDYGTRRPMPLARMEQQCTLGLRWLKERRLEGMIFLASCICDLDLEAVRWIARHGDEPLS